MSALEQAVPVGMPELAWWLSDPGLWELLECDERHDSDGLPVDPSSKDRAQLLDDLIRLPEPVDLDFARFLLVQETRWHGHSWGFSHSIELAALLVAEHRQVQDIWLLWEAVARSFDTWCGFQPHTLLFAAGTARTVEYIGTCDHAQRSGLLEHLHEIPEPSEEAVIAHLTGRRRYYVEILDELDTP
ncbi:hypothetical protein [Streptomyces sp. NPDC048111]|uniref:hypothetical protein n=1 Tax=Streptomyces sp. NPDC048111 TaxID=3365500 RepID=UPI003722F128